MKELVELSVLESVLLLKDEEEGNTLSSEEKDDLCWDRGVSGFALFLLCLSFLLAPASSGLVHGHFLFMSTKPPCLGENCRGKGLPGWA